MTEQQAQNPIDDFFRNTFENLPDTPAESGWDTPSDRVWQHVQANIQTPKKGWGIQMYVLLAAFAVVAVAGLYWMFAAPVEKPAVPPSPVEQPVQVSETPAEKVENQPTAAPNSSTGTTIKEKSKPTPRNSTEEKQVMPSGNAAQPLPGSKTTLPPNTTEAQKKKGENN
jgi:hypothetical protein